MTNQAKVVSLKLVASDGNPVDYVMIEGEDVERAKSLASRWAEQNITEPFDRIEEHQGVINAPEGVNFTILDGERVWHLPF